MKRRGTTKSKVSVENFSEIQRRFLEEITTTVQMHEIPSELIFNWDQTGINLVPTTTWTMDERGSKRVEIAGLIDKRQITAVLCGCITFFHPRSFTREKHHVVTHSSTSPVTGTSHTQ